MKVKVLLLFTPYREEYHTGSPLVHTHKQGHEFSHPENIQEVVQHCHDYTFFFFFASHDYTFLIWWIPLLEFLQQDQAFLQHNSFH